MRGANSIAAELYFSNCSLRRGSGAVKASDPLAVGEAH
jgi:hypothetical protein